jgi:hypothetical protein
MKWVAPMSAWVAIAKNKVAIVKVWVDIARPISCHRIALIYLIYSSSDVGVAHAGLLSSYM